jgi:hypothetical protein
MWSEVKPLIGRRQELSKQGNGVSKSSLILVQKLY